jgi:NAD dependent epimerase/dehydratase family enzyme
VNAFAGALRRPAFFPLPEFVWNLVFGEQRAAIITQGQKVSLPPEIYIKFRFFSFKLISYG